MGTYNNAFKIVDTAARTVHMGDLSRDNASGAVAPPVARQLGDEDAASETPTLSGYAAQPYRPLMTDFELNKKAMHYSWNPNEDCVAVAGRSSLFIYTGR